MRFARVFPAISVARLQLDIRAGLRAPVEEAGAIMISKGMERPGPGPWSEQSQTADCPNAVAEFRWDAPGENHVRC